MLVLEPELVVGLLDCIEIVVEAAPQALWVSWSKLDHNELAEQEAFLSEHHRPLPKQRGLQRAPSLAGTAHVVDEVLDRSRHQ